MPVHPSVSRRVVRRAVRTPCLALSARWRRPIGYRVLDMSPNGLLVEGTHTLLMMMGPTPRVGVGAPLAVTFQAPGDEGYWYEAEAEVARVVRGFRRTDRGLGFGLSFTDIALRDKIRLSRALRGLPPPVPARAPRR